MADWIALFRAAKHPRLVDPIDNRDITDNRSALPEATALPEPREGAAANVNPVDNSDITDNRAAAPSAIVTNVTIVNQPELLRKALQAAVKAGAEFRIVGADVEIHGGLPDALRAQLPLDTIQGEAREVRKIIEAVVDMPA
jgi:hypothetical protein